MSRTVLVMASILLVAGGWLLQRSAARPPAPSTPVGRSVAEQGISLTRIDPLAPVRLSTEAEIEAEAAWWQRQDIDVLKQLR
ncbi:MAG TPA: hypothetical protein VHX44_02705, partial [Planctomycetota bacterium]|nr:hypothetical protein [Planctomycetota bacterium]